MRDEMKSCKETSLNMLLLFFHAPVTNKDGNRIKIREDMTGALEE